MHVTAGSSFRFYEVQSPATPVVWSRRRLVQTLGASYVRRFARDDDPPLRLTVRLQLRLDQDFGRTCLVDGGGCIEATNVSDEGEFQVLARDGRIDAPVAAAELHGLPGGTELRVGRHLRPSLLGFLRLDGVSVRVAPAPWVAVDAYGGTMVRATTLAGSDAFAPQGSVRLDLPDELSRARVPFVAPPSTTWVAGGWLELGRSDWVRGRIGYREVQDGDGIVARRLGFGLASQPVPALRLAADGALDAAFGTLIDARVRVDVRTGPVRSHAQLSRHVPRFDYGTIWAYFDVVPVDRARLGASVDVARGVSLDGALVGRRAHFDDRSAELDGGFEAGARVRRGRTRIETSAFGFAGNLGPVAAVRLFVLRPVTSFMDLSLRASVWHFDDPLRQGMHGTTTLEAIAARFRLSELTAIRLEVEHARSRVTGHRLRGLLTLALEVWR